MNKKKMLFSNLVSLGESVEFWRATAFLLLGIMLFGMLFEIKIKSKLGQIYPPSQSISFQVKGTSNSNNTSSNSQNNNVTTSKTASLPQGSGGCGV